MSTLAWIALVVALVLIVPAAIRIVATLLPRGADDGTSGGTRALDTVWTIVPIALLAVLVGFSVAAA